MATYADLYAIKNDASLLGKVAVAVIKKAQLLLDGVAPTSNQLTWVEKALSNPEAVARVLLNYVIVVNSTLTVAQIQGASDTAVQSNVNDAVDKMIAGGIV